MVFDINVILQSKDNIFTGIQSLLSFYSNTHGLLLT
nr:MAG TPA: hypothetical protein [Caudoviricetes sp.]